MEAHGEADDWVRDRLASLPRPQIPDEVVARLDRAILEQGMIPAQRVPARASSVRHGATSTAPGR